MTVKECAQILNAKCVCMPDGERTIECGYTGDLLSFVIGRAPSSCVWFTVMNNVNVCAVATLADVAVVVLCEGVYPDDALKQRVQEQGVNLLVCGMDACCAIKALGERI